MIFQPGDTLDGGKYIIKALLGRGGMGEVYLAHQTSVDREVAIKVLYQKLTSESVIKRRFHREAKLMAKLNHPHCVTVYDFGETPEGILYIVMERLEGHTLSEELILVGVIPLHQTLSIIRQTCLALQRAHSLSLVHRDLKPENIFLTPREQSDSYQEGDDDFHVTILDFGIAKVLQEPVSEAELTAMPDDDLLGETSEHIEDTLSETLDAARSSATLQSRARVTPQSRRRQERSLYTQENAIIGTPLYMSPEHARSADIDHRSDIYALGLILYECLSGHPAFRGNSVVELLMAHARQPPPRLSDSRPDLPPKISELIECCLAKRKEERLREVSLILSYIQKFQVGEPLEEEQAETLSTTLEELRRSQSDLDGRSEPQPPRASPPPTRSPVVWGVALTSSLLLGAIVVLLSSPRQPQEPLSGPLAEAKWSDLYLPNGKPRIHSTTMFSWDFDRDLFGRTTNPEELISNLREGSSAMISRSWLHRSKELKDPGEDDLLRGVRFEPPYRNRLIFDTLARLPHEFTLEFWIYLSPTQYTGQCASPIISTLKASSKDFTFRCDANTLWSGGWSLLGKANSSRVTLEFQRFTRSQDSKTELTHHTLSAPQALYYKRWSHIVIRREADVLTWVINGEANEMSDPYDWIVTQDTHIYLGQSPKRTQISTLQMRIDDLRISRAPLPIEWAQRAYRARLKSVRVEQPLKKEVFPPLTLSY